LPSSSAEKIARAIALGAKGGVDYTDEGGWAKKLQKMLPKGRPFLDAVIDGAGGDIVGTTWKLFKMGAAIVNYGMTGLQQPVFPMQAVMKNVEFKGSTMGSRGGVRGDGTVCKEEADSAGRGQSGGWNRKSGGNRGAF